MVLTVEGEHVLFGTSSGYVDSMSAGQARTPLIPPTIGHGPVTVTIKVTVRTGQPDEGVLSMVQRSGFIIGPIILLIYFFFNRRSINITREITTNTAPPIVMALPENSLPISNPRPTPPITPTKYPSFPIIKKGN